MLNAEVCTKLAVGPPIQLNDYFKTVVIHLGDEQKN